MAEFMREDGTTVHIDIDLIRRAATASRNVADQVMPNRKADWFAWVPEHLTALADRLEGDSESGGLTDD